MNIVVIEDDATERELLIGLLSEDGHAVSGADSLAAGRELLRQSRWGAVIVDLELPDATGSEAVREVVQGAPGAAVLVFTGHGDDEGILEACLAAGADDVVEKPARYTVIRHSLIVGRAQRDRSLRRIRSALVATVELATASLHGAGGRGA